MICPCCNGTGTIENPKKLRIKELLIIKLFASGITYREIMKITGHKSTSGIHHYLKKHNLVGGKNGINEHSE